MNKRPVLALIAGVTALLTAATIGDAAPSPARAGADHGTAEQRTAGRTHALLAALEREDLHTVAAMTDQRATLTVALSFSGDQEPAGQFVGKEQVLGYVESVFTNMATIDFVEVRVSVTADGKTSFVQANGEFVGADGRPYRNVYVFRYDWHNGRVVTFEEYANPVTFCETFGHPDC